MEDQGKRLLLAVLAAFGVMMLWNYLFPPEPPPQEVQPDETAEQRETTETDDAAPDPGPAPRTPEIVEADDEVVAAPEPVERAPEELFAFDYPAFRAVFTNYGGKLKSWELKGKRFQADGAGEPRQIDLVRTDDPDLLPFALRFEDIDWDTNAAWKGEKKSDTEMQFSWAYRVPGKNGNSVVAFELVKTYKLYPEHYLLELTIDVVNKASKDERQAVVVSLYGYQDPTEDTGGGWTSVDRAWKSACYINGELSTSGVESLSGGGKKLRSGDVQWGGFQHSYFLFAAAPHVQTDAQLACNSYGVEGEPGLMRTDVVLPVVNIRRGGPPATHALVAYLGPKYLDKLESVSAVAGFNPHFGEAVDLGWLGFIARPLLWLLEWFHAFLGNWGLAIIFLTVLVKLATLYWTTKSMRSMKEMAKLKPKISELQEKYKDDKQRQQVEMMNLYKAHNVNPLAGCLPMLLQMPIWFALYRMLMAAAELYHAPFIPGWIDDLTAQDPYYILPISLVVLMFVQAKLSPSPADSTQQKMMTYGLPLMFGGFSFFFPAGLTLYICTNTVLTAVHHLWMRRNEPSPQEQKSDAGDKGGRAAKAKAPSAAGADKAARSDEEADTASSGSAQPRAAAKGPKKSKSKRSRAQQKRRGGKPKRGGGKS